MLVLYQSCEGTGTVFESNCRSHKIDFSFQIELLRSLKEKDGNPLTKNYRPPLELNGRTVKASFKGATNPPTTSGSTAKPTAGASVSRMTAGLFLSMLMVLFALQ